MLMLLQLAGKVKNVQVKAAGKVSAGDIKEMLLTHHKIEIKIKDFGKKKKKTKH